MTAPARTRARGGAPNASRDQSESAFASILGGLVSRVPGARAAALVDFQGETVDYAGRATPFDLRLAAAHWRIVLDEVDAQSCARGLHWLVVRAARVSYLVYALPDRYALVIVLYRAAGFAGWHRAVAACARALAEEAAWGRVRAASAPWFPVEVLSDARRRPRSIRIAGCARQVEILGTIVRRPHPPSSDGTSTEVSKERGWRVRFDTGAEATLLREPGGAWYADQLFEGPAPGRGFRKSR